MNLLPNYEAIQKNLEKYKLSGSHLISFPPSFPLFIFSRTRENVSLSDSGLERIIREIFGQL